MSFSAWTKLHTRRREPERMDQPDLPGHEHRHALQSLARINWFSCSSHILAPAIFNLAASIPSRPLRVLDLACGGGDILISLARKAAAKKLVVEWHGLDFSPVAIQHANELAARSGVTVHFQQCDVLNAPLPAGFDVIMCSLFLHHLDEQDAVTLLTHMREATANLVLVNDLRRSHFGYLLAHFACRLLSRSSVVHFDGPVSVAGALNLQEIEAVARRAGLNDAKIVRRWPQRYLLTWRKT